MRLCNIESCKKQYNCRGYCKSHVIRLRKYGDPLGKTTYEHLKALNLAEYNAWSNLISRCENPKNTSYKRYGGRGVSVYPQWRQSFAHFLKDVGKKPGHRYSIDRINNDGNYEPGNIRWATRSMQAYNKGLKATNTSGYRGVWLSYDKKWVSAISKDSRRIRIGQYNTKEEAAEAYNATAIKLHGEDAKLNVITNIK